MKADNIVTTGSPFFSVYSTTKAGIRGLTQAVGELATLTRFFCSQMCVASELGRHGITVNSYAPGVIDTDMRECILVASTLSLTLCKYTLTVRYCKK